MPVTKESDSIARMPLLLSMLVERRVSPGDHVLDGVSGPQFGQPKADRSVSGACGENGVDATHPLCRLGAVESWQRANELVAAIYRMIKS